MSAASALEARLHESLNGGKPAYYEVMEDAIHIYSWCPTPDPAASTPTQVHLHLPFAGTVVIIRFKSPKTLDKVIAALEDHRQDVWGKR